MIEIKPKKIERYAAIVPGSKSYTHRILVAAALADGISTIENGLVSDDTLLTLNALKKMGTQIENLQDRFVVSGTNGCLESCRAPLFLGNSGTSMRLITALAAIGQGEYLLSGTKRMHERPLQDLLDGLHQIEVNAISVNQNGCPPVKVTGMRVTGGKIELNCGTSSQYLSALLLIAPYTIRGIEIKVTNGPVSKPYIDMTVDVMQRMGIEVQRSGYDLFAVKGGQVFRAGRYAVEPDCSQAGYFWAAAAITGASVTVRGINADSRQGDIRFVELLEKMGCSVIKRNDGIKVVGPPLLAGVDVDMGDMPDLVPTLAVVAAFAKGTTRIRNVAHLRVKESDRIGAVVNELEKMGIKALCRDDGMEIHGGIPHGAKIKTYDDHRIAMSFALAGLNIPGIFICNERCVEKSFPQFWNVFNQMGIEV
ncbi:MAG: 3-phosphoshikimate 1-carboxyvinyltransferase [Desulfobacteraceae bacterium 4572_123]|nr:MAG: 3-phosphoshikimate 1-carboxyvinyltransferase [Desulfobacteraceae bacterium 4572_123]